MAIQFDAPNKRIVLDSNAVTASQIWIAWIDWVAVGDNSKWLPAMKQVGGEQLTSNIFIPPYLFLLNGWRVRPMEADHDLTITGNLFVEGGGVPVVRTLGTYQVNVNYTVPIQAQAIQGSDLQAKDVWDYPVNNMTDVTTAGGYIARTLLNIPKFLGLK